MPLELSLEALAGDAEILRLWKGSDVFPVFEKYLDKMSDDVTARIINYRSGLHEDDAYNKGILAGLKMALQVPENVQGWYVQAKAATKRS